jgi:hypothetical protein
MPRSARPIFAVYVLWHPNFLGGSRIAELLRSHFHRQVYTNVAGGHGLSVLFRNAPMPKSAVPMPIDLTDAESTAVVVLSERHLVNDEAWVKYVHALAAKAEKVGFRARLFPVSITRKGLELGLEEQAIRRNKQGHSAHKRTHI